MYYLLTDCSFGKSSEYNFFIHSIAFHNLDTHRNSQIACPVKNKQKQRYELFVLHLLITYFLCVLLLALCTKEVLELVDIMNNSSAGLDSSHHF